VVEKAKTTASVPKKYGIDKSSSKETDHGTEKGQTGRIVNSGQGEVREYYESNTATRAGKKIGADDGDEASEGVKRTSTSRPLTKGVYFRRTTTTTTPPTVTTTGTTTTTTITTTKKNDYSLILNRMSDFEKRIAHFLLERDEKNKEVEFLEDDAFADFERKFNGNRTR
jgi:hypothetical protein